MSIFPDIAKGAFHLYEERRITKKQLVDILKECVNGVAVENGYANQYGLPFRSKRDAGNR